MEQEPRRLEPCEAELPLELERVYSKDEILEMYLNEVYYGHGAYGVRTAAMTYFGKDPGNLSLAEPLSLRGNGVAAAGALQISGGASTLSGNVSLAAKRGGALTPEAAAQLTKQTFLGAARLAIESADTMGEMAS